MLAPASLDRTALITALGNLYQEWHEAAAGQPLEAVSASVGLLLDDVMTALSLTELEQGQVKGWWRQGFSNHGKTP